MDTTRTLLLVEDNPGDVRLVVEMLRDYGADVAVTGVETQAAAIDRLAEGNVDVVLLDLGLPDSQGLETFTRLHDAAPDVAIIVLTGNSDLELAIHAVEQGAQDFLVKDRVNGELLTRAITYAIERKHAEQELAESEARYRALAEGSPLAVLVCRSDKDDDEVVLVNAACMELFGACSPEELIGRSTLDLFHPDSQQLVRGPIREATGETVPFIEARIVRVDGTPLDVDIAAAPLLDKGMPATQVVLRDITEIKKAHERTARLAAIVTSSPDPILTKDLHEVITSWNPAAEALFGYRAEEVIGTGMEVLLPPGLKGEPRRLTKRLLKGEKVEQFETQRKRKDGSLVDVALTLFPIPDEKGHVAAISVMAHDITQDRRAEEALRQSEGRYAAVFRAVPDSLTVTRLRDGEIIDANDGYERMFGYTRAESVGKTISGLSVFADSDERQRLSVRLRKDGQVRGLESTLQRKDGTSFTGSASLQVLEIQGEEYVVTVIRDRTEQEKAEQERLRAEGFFRDTFEHADVGIAHVNSTDGTWLRVNQRMCDLLGYTREELLRTTFAAITHPDDVEENVRHLHRMLAGDEETYRADKRYLRKDGSIVWVHLNVALIRKEDGTPDYNITVMTDITERKRAEDALIASERFAQRVLDTSPNIIHISDLVENRYVYANREITEFLGYTPEQVLVFGSSLFEQILHPEDAEIVAEHHERVRKLPPGDDSVLEVDYRMKRVDGEWRWFHSRDTPFLRDESGVVTQVLGSTQDVTDQRSATQRLQESEAKLKALFEFLPVGVSVLDAENRVTYANPALGRILGIPEGLRERDYAARTYLDGNGDPLSPDGFASARAAREGRVVEVETGVVKEDGQVVWTDVSATPIAISDWRTIIVTADITERMQAKEALASSESRLKAMLDQAPMGIALVDSLTGRIYDANPMAAKILGWTVEGLREVDWMSFTHPDDVQADLDNMARLNAGETNGFQMDKRLIRPDGSTAWIKATVAPVLVGDEAHPRHIRMIQDITAEREAKGLLTQQAERIKRTLTSVIDIAGNIGEMRDPYTAGHQRRVAQLAARLAQELGVSDSEVANIRVAGLLHDVGKTAVPTEILSKPGTISPIEFDLIKGHAEAGYRIAVSANMDEPIPELIHQHHERCDGSGYPLGLLGDQILPGAKVLAVADVVEAMMSHRPYRPALGTKAALAEIERGAGSLYDAEVSKVCVALFREGHFEFSSPTATL